MVAALLDPELPFDPLDCVTINLDGGNRAGFDQLELTLKENPRTGNASVCWCSGHGVGLLCGGVADVGGIKELIEEVRAAVTFARTHSKPANMIREEEPNKGLTKWCDTRFATVFLVLERMLSMRRPLKRVVLSDAWGQYVTSITKAEIRTKAQKFADFVLDASNWAKITKVLELTDMWYWALRTFDSDKPTVSVAYKTWLELEAAAQTWHDDRFAKVDIDGVPTTAFVPSDGLIPLGNTEATGKNWVVPRTVPAMVSARWTILHNAGGTGRMHSAGYAVNPCFHPNDMKLLDDDFYAHIKHYYDDALLVEKIYGQWEDYRLESEHGPLFTRDGARIPSCDYEASGGTDGVDWWKHELPREYKVKWAELRKYAIRVLSQTSTETSAERHFSLMEVEQPKGRSALGIGRTGDMVFVRSEILQHMDDRCSSITAINTLEELDSWNGEQEAEVLVDEHGAPAVLPAQLAQHAQPAAGPPPVAQLQAELNSAAGAGAGN